MDLYAIENKIQALTLKDQHFQTSVAKNSEYYYSLFNKDEQDGNLRRKIYLCIMDQLQREREDTTFSRNCLFCKKHFTGNRSNLLAHLKEQHNFYIGDPNNIVFINELLDHLEQMLKGSQCFFCERIYRDYLTLKEHMRKKQHKKIDPLNKYYDRFYSINYLESGKTWKDVEKEADDYSQDSGKELMDWGDCSVTYVCLFCSDSACDFNQAWQHMKEVHGFDFKQLKTAHQLNFYQQIRLVNYIRKKMHEKECISCDLKFDFHVDLLTHLTMSGHLTILPHPSLWDQPMYYFPTFENDSLLCALEDENSDCEEGAIYPEDIPV
ncbi:zinc finger protein 277-like isoform X2 [Argiope bruennichi]|uniref:zinc finger protein 277-like isoform X2 n=1 Tax=Argiope bruennichi TaxID=94029 RepID=UPI0024941509|nr:zinc finger protein 277-like isoform X2 [Argiope bruennichi]